MHQVTPSLLAGRISTTGNEMQGTRQRQETTQIRDKIQGIKQFASHLPAFPYHLLKSFILCKLPTAGTLLFSHFPTALQSICYILGYSLAGRNATRVVPTQAHALTAMSSHLLPKQFYTPGTLTCC